MDTLTLDTLKVGESGTVTALYATDSMRRRLLDIGLTKGTTVTCLSLSPAGDPIAFYIRGATIALRRKDCVKIEITRQTDGETDGSH